MHTTYILRARPTLFSHVKISLILLSLQVSIEKKTKTYLTFLFLICYAILVHFSHAFNIF